MNERTPLTDIGEYRISLSDKSFFLKPSFRAMNEIGSGEEIVQMYVAVNGSDYVNMMKKIESTTNTWAANYLTEKMLKPKFSVGMLSAACIIMQSCCDDDISVLIGNWKCTKNGIKYSPALMPANDIIIIARSLMEHGIIGKSPLKVPLKQESKQNRTNKFNVAEYINSARAHLGVTREEAENLTMTEYQQIIKVKFPEPDGLTREQHEQSYEDAKALRDKIAAKRARLNGINKNGN